MYYCPPSRGLIRTTKSEITLIQLLPPLRGLIRLSQQLRCACKLLPPIAGIDICLCYHLFHFDAIAPSIAGIDSMPRAVSCSTAAPLPHSSIHLPHPLFAFPSPLSIQVRRLLRFENDHKKYIRLSCCAPRKNDIMCMNEKINAFCIRFGSVGMFLKSEGRKP